MCLQLQFHTCNQEFATADAILSLIRVYSVLFGISKTTFVLKLAYPRSRTGSLVVKTNSTSAFALIAYIRQELLWQVSCKSAKHVNNE